MNIEFILVKAFVALSVMSVVAIIGGMIAGSMPVLMVGASLLISCFACGFLALRKSLTEQQA